MYKFLKMQKLPNCNILRKYEKPIDTVKDFLYNADTLQRQYKNKGTQRI